MSQARWTRHFARTPCLALRGKFRVLLAWHSSACLQDKGDQRTNALAFFIWCFLCNDRNCRIAVSHSLYIFYTFYVYTFSFSVYVFFVCILFVHFFLVYVSSVHFLLYKQLRRNASVPKFEKLQSSFTTDLYYHECCVIKLALGKLNKREYTPSSN